MSYHSFSKPYQESEAITPDKGYNLPYPDKAYISFKRRAKASLRRIYLRHLRLITPIFGIYYIFLTASHFLLLSGPLRLTMMALTFASAVVSFSLQTALLKGKIRSKRAHISFVPLGVFGIVNVLTHILFTQDQIQFTNLTLGFMGFSFLILSPPIYIFFGIFSVVGFFTLMALVPGPYTVHLTFMFFTALVIGIIAFINRYQTTIRQTMLAAEKQAKARALTQLNRLVEQQAETAQKAAAAAEAASEAKSRFLANTSHELRTPLTGVLGMASLLEKTNLDADQKEMVEAVRSSARGLMVVLNDILDFAKLEAGGLTLTPEAFRASDVIQKIANLLKPEAHAKGLSFEVDRLQDDFIWLYGDPVRLGQILFNLVGNAIKFTEQGGVRIMSSITKLDDTQRRLEISVIDSGPGISENDQSVLFERFQQANDSRNRSGGTGLGLAICKELVDLMGGTIELESVLGDGSRFSIFIPLTQIENKYMHKEEEEETAPDAEKEERPLRFLLAEDNAINQLLLEKMLKKSGWHLTIVNNGRKAVDAALFNALPFDLILMDIQMPEMDGVTALAEIDENMHNRPPVIALTANIGPDDIEVYKKAGFDAFVGKPIDMNILIAEINRCLDKQKEKTDQKVSRLSQTTKPMPETE